MENPCDLNLPFNGVIEFYRSIQMTLVIKTKVPALRKAPVKWEAAGVGCDGL
jgi:hypothetical protein